MIFKLENQTVEGDVSAELKAKMLILAQPDIDALIIDLSKADAIDSSGLGALLLATVSSKTTRFSNSRRRQRVCPQFDEHDQN